MEKPCRQGKIRQLRKKKPYKPINQQGDKMIRQTVLPFKIEKTADTITTHGGLALFGEFVVGTGILGAIDEHLLKLGSSVGYNPSEYIFPIVLMLNGGGRKLEDIRVIRQDEGMREILSLGRLPSADAIGDWLRSKGVDGGLDLLEKDTRDICR